jgi:AraC-like DNA-binding protein
VSAERPFENVLLELAAARSAGDLIYVHSKVIPGSEAETRPSLHRHVSDGHEFAFVTQGQAGVATPEGVYDLSPRRLLLIGRGVEHDESPSDPPGPYVMCWCYADHTYARLDQTTYTPPRTWQAGPSIELVGRTDVENIAAAIATELEHKDWGWERSTLGLLSYLTCILMRRLRRGSVVRLRPTESLTISADPHTWRVIQSALQFCDANFRKPLRLADVAAAVGYSPSHLSRLISTHLGHSLSDHIRNLRLQAGKQLLESSDSTISEIARSLGYADPSHFSHAFSRATGLSPKAYRERLTGL